MKWQPIETVPIDGTPVLVWLGAPAPQYVGIGPVPKINVVVADFWEHDPFLVGPYGETSRATHWMPLPDPPQ